MPNQSSRRRPWPWDARMALSGQKLYVGTIADSRGKTIGSLRPLTIAQLRSSTTNRLALQGMMLVPNQSGLLVGKKQTPLSPLYFPTADYGSSPVYKEHTFEFRPTGGMGESVQSTKTDRRYHYAMDCWVTGGLVGKGPLCHHVSPTSTGLVRRFIEALNAGTLSLFFLAGPYVLRRSDDTDGGQVVSLNHAPSNAMDAARFKGAYSTPVDGLYVTYSDGTLYEYDGAAWHPCVLPAGFLPQFLEIVGDELWAADPSFSVLRKCTNDPKLAGSWGGPILVGNPSIPITAIRQTQNHLCIFKANGDVFTINADGSDNDLFPGLQTTVDTDNARTATAWQGSLWFRTGRAFWQLDMQSGAVLTPTGPGRMLANTSPVRGPVQAFAGWNSQMAFAAIYNAGDNISYLLTYGNWEPMTGDTGTSFQFIPQYDGSIAHWPNRRVTALFVSNIPSDARLYIGFADGSYDWIKLVPFPLMPGIGAEYTLTDAYIVTPLHHDMFQADNKQFVGYSIYGPSFPTDGRVDISYRISGTASLPPTDPSGGFLESTEPFHFNGQRNDFSVPVAGIALETKIDLASSSSSTTPVLEGIGIHQRLVPAFKRDWSFTVDARDFAARRDGASTRQSGRMLRDLMIQAAASPAQVSVELPEETVFDVAVFDYAERMLPHSVTGSQGWGLDVQITQFTVLTTYGSIGRTRGTTIGALRGWSIGSLRHF